VVTDQNGCSEAAQEIKVDDCDKSDCYTGSIIMTPNGDEFNEYFLIKCFDDFESNELHVYDRLGNEVYTQSNYDGTWNGLDNNGNDLIEGSYMWVFIGMDENGNQNVYKGTVTLLRK
ncbi:MAG TPA: gliding motility-associated C-terminal domain-containing protein, partial [Bacteroidetes bacterium]|nr:gliding motility-associated C-terminal domain-containing protein [Bacteroidota bacterium]